MSALRFRIVSYCAALLLSSTIGCNSGRYPVTGKVLYPDGTPVPSGTVIGEATVDGKLVAVQGNIESNGSFTLGGAQPNEGALPGSYRIAIMPESLSDAELASGKQLAVDGKYGNMATSGLTLEVKDGPNELKITVEKPGPKRR